MGALAQMMPRFTSTARQAAVVRSAQVLSAERTRGERTVRTMEQPAVLRGEVSFWCLDDAEGGDGLHVSGTHENAEEKFGAATDLQVAEEE